MAAEETSPNTHKSSLTPLDTDPQALPAAAAVSEGMNKEREGSLFENNPFNRL